MKIAHIVNPVKVDKDRDLYFQQPITFESMLIAEKFAAGQVEVKLIVTGYPEDEDLFPDKRLHTKLLKQYYCFTQTTSSAGFFPARVMLATCISPLS